MKCYQNIQRTYRKGENREVRGEVYKLGARSGEENTRYMIREVTQRDKLKRRAGRRSWKFEKKLEDGRGSEIARKCLEEAKERGRRRMVGSSWEEERREFLEVRGMGVEEIEGWREGGEEWFNG